MRESCLYLFAAISRRTLQTDFSRSPLSLALPSRNRNLLVLLSLTPKSLFPFVDSFPPFPHPLLFKPGALQVQASFQSSNRIQQSPIQSSTSYSLCIISLSLHPSIYIYILYSHSHSLCSRCNSLSLCFSSL